MFVNYYIEAISFFLHRENIWPFFQYLVIYSIFFLHNLIEITSNFDLVKKSWKMLNQKIDVALKKHRKNKIHSFVCNPEEKENHRELSKESRKARHLTDKHFEPEIRNLCYINKPISVLYFWICITFFFSTESRSVISNIYYRTSFLLFR